MNYTTGLLYGSPHLFTAASKESIQLNMITLAFAGNRFAQIWVDNENPENFQAKAMDILEKKIKTYHKFNQTVC